MEIKIIQLWGADYQPWQASSYPWNTVNFNEKLAISQQSVDLKYGFKIPAITEKLFLRTITPTLGYGIKYLAEVSNLVISQITPQRFGTLWERIAGIATNWDKINKGSSIWESYGTILWSWRNSPWLSTSYPWLEKGGAKPVTSYNSQTKPTTNYSGVNKQIGRASCRERV